MFQLAGNGFVMFSHEMLPHQTIKQTQNITFTITTAESKGLLFWQAVDHGQSIRKNDYLSIYLKDGLVVFRLVTSFLTALVASKNVEIACGEK